MRELTVSIDRFPIAGKFTIARAPAPRRWSSPPIEETEPRPENACLSRYGETVEGVAAAIEAIRPQIEAGLTREALQDLMPRGRPATRWTAPSGISTPSVPASAPM